jgi:hypothetical protein
MGLAKRRLLTQKSPQSAGIFIDARQNFFFWLYLRRTIVQLN